MNRWTGLLAAVAVLAAAALPMSLPANAAAEATPTPAPPTTGPTAPRPSATSAGPTRRPTRPRPTYSPRDYEAERREQQAKAEAYLDGVAEKLGEPGIWVDPAVKKLSATEISELDGAAKGAVAPIRIAVIRAQSINVLPSSLSTGSAVRLAWQGEEIADQLYDRVGVEGVYAVLVDASSERAGRGLHAVQRADKGPTYHVGDAVDQAVDCCAPDYEDMLDRFIQRAQQVDKPFYVDAAPYAGGLAGLVFLWWGGTAFAARRRRLADEKAHLEVSRPLLTEEIIALSQQVSALPTTPDPQQSKLSKDILDTVEKARQRLDAAKRDADTEAVATLLGSARYGLACLAALQAGRPVPEPTPPCFFDPRHGPSTSRAEWTPEGGAERPVQVCDACATRLAAKQQPDIRMVMLRDRARPYWTLGEELASYIDGYWSRGDQRWRFPDDDARREADRMRARWRGDRPGARIGRWTSDVGSSASSWSSNDNDNDDDSDSSGWSSRPSRRSYSRRTRSSGGGSSRRSSRRSGGSRGF